jgi:hypothetical protein
VHERLLETRAALGYDDDDVLVEEPARAAAAGDVLYGRRVSVAGLSAP